MKFLILSIFIVSFIITYCIIHKILNKNSNLLEAEANRAIAENSLTFDEVKMSKRLRPIIRHINKAALKGRVNYSPTGFENMILIRRFDKTQLKDFFKSHGYGVEFHYDYYPDSDINYIYW
jgi:hypothetical protein